MLSHFNETDLMKASSALLRPSYTTSGSVHPFVSEWLAGARSEEITLFVAAQKSTNVSCRYGEIKRFTLCLECIHADQFSVVRQEWSARVSWVDRGLRLNDVRAVLDLGFGFLANAAAAPLPGTNLLDRLLATTGAPRPAPLPGLRSLLNSLYGSQN